MTFSGKILGLPWLARLVAGLGWAGLGWAGLHSAPSHPAHYLQLVQPSPLARARAQGAAGWDHLLDQGPAPLKVPTKFRGFLFSTGICPQQKHQ